MKCATATKRAILRFAGVALLCPGLVFSAAAITLPVCEVVERPQKNVSTYPGRVVPIAQVDVTPQVSGEILEVCFANGAEVKAGDVLYRINWMGTDPAKRAFYRAFRDLNPLNDLGIG